MEKLKLFAYGLVAAAAFAMATSPVFARWDSLAALATGNATGAALSGAMWTFTGAAAPAFRARIYAPLRRQLNYFRMIFTALTATQGLIFIFLLLNVAEFVALPPDVTYFLAYVFQVVSIAIAISHVVAVKSFKVK